MHENKDHEGEVEISKSEFVELVQTLLRDQSEKDHFFMKVFSIQYRAHFDTALQVLVWEFFYRLEEFPPVPSFSQVFSMFDILSLDCKFEQFVSDPEDLKRILQQQQERRKLTKSEFTFMSDTIIAALASKQVAAASEDHFDQNTGGGGADEGQDTGKSKGRDQGQSEEKTPKQEDDGGADDFCEDDEGTDDSSTETNQKSRLHTYGLSPLTSSPCSEEGGATDETDCEAAFQPPRRSQSSAEGMKELLDLSRKEKPPEERATVSKSCSENTCLECAKTFASHSSLKKHHVVHFHSSSGLKKHTRTHMGDKLHRCLTCHKTFSQKSNMKIHFKVHKNI